jgi:hypothetical protein
MADCASCGKALDADARFCRHCGAATGQDDDATMPMPAAAAAGEDTQGLPGAGEDAGTLPSAGDDENTTIMPGTGEDARTLPGAGADEPTQVLPPTSADATEQTTADLPVAGAAAGTWSCAACGATAHADDRFCGRCGAGRLPAGAVSCASCGASLQPDMEFCPRCGARRGQMESAASRAETTVLPAAAYVAHATAPTGAGTPPPAGPGTPPPPLPPSSQQRRDKGRGGRIAVIVVAVLVLAAIAAGVYFVFFFDKGGPQDATAPIEPIISGLVPDQGALNDDLQALTADEQSFAAAAESAQQLVDAIGGAQEEAGAIVVDDPEAAGILTAFRRALDAHADYAATLADLPADPLDFTAAQADIALTRAGSAKAAYDKLAELAPTLPEMPFPDAATDQLAEIADEVEAQAGQLADLQSFLQSIEALFPDSQSERLTAEDILAQLEATEIPPDNAAGQMAAQAVRLRGVAGQIDASAPPDDQRAQQIQATYREAVLHWVTAARQYATWMRHLQEYYQVSGDWPPVNGIEADTYLDPAYTAAREAADLATASREKLAGEIDELAGEVGGTTGYTADDM